MAESDRRTEVDSTVNWYVINGEYTNTQGAGREIVRVTKAACYDDVIRKFKSDFNRVTCINVDILRESTAKSYKVLNIQEERTVVYLKDEEESYL